MIILYLYGVPESVDSATISRLLSVLGGILQGTKRLELGLNDVDWFAPWSRTDTKRGSRVVLKVEEFKELAAKRNLDEWEIIALKKQLEQKIESFIEGSLAYCYFT